MQLQEALAGIDHHLWSSEPDVAQFLACLVRMHHCRDVVEVGVFKGLTASYLIDSLGSRGRYIGIDLEDYRCESVRAYMEATGHSFVLGDSRAQLKKLAGGSADLIFLDGDHSLAYVKGEFLESLRILRPKGIICIHDYHSRGVRIWVDYVKRCRAFETLVFNTSEDRGVAVIVPKKGMQSAGPLFRLWFALSRSQFALRVQGKLESVFSP